MMKLKKLALATSIALSAMAVAGTAQAGALATSVLDISNYVIRYNATGVQVDRGNFASLAPVNNLDVSAALNPLGHTRYG